MRISSSNPVASSQVGPPPAAAERRSEKVDAGKAGPSTVNDAFESSTAEASAAGGSTPLGQREIDLRKLVADNLGEEAAKYFDQLPMEQKREMAMQAVVQRNGSQRVANMLQTLHDMKKAILQNTRG